MTMVPFERRGDAPVSVIVPCYNSARTIRACLDALRAQDTLEDYSVVVVDSSTDDTPRIVAEAFPEVGLVRFEAQTWAGAARNHGIAATGAPWCLMLDSDCVSAPDMIRRLRARHDAGEWDAVGGAVVQELPASLSDRVAHLLEFKDWSAWVPSREVQMVPTACVMYRRTALERVGGFDPTLKWGEDVLLNWQICQSGGRIYFDAEVQITHLKHVAPQKLLRMAHEHGEWSAQVRIRTNMPGSVFVRHPSLRPLLPLVRVGRAMSSAAQHDRSSLARPDLWALYGLACAAWAAGFNRTLKRHAQALRSGAA